MKNICTDSFDCKTQACPDCASVSFSPSTKRIVGFHDLADDGSRCVRMVESQLYRCKSCRTFFSAYPENLVAEFQMTRRLLAHVRSLVITAKPREISRQLALPSSIVEHISKTELSYLDPAGDGQRPTIAIVLLRMRGLCYVAYLECETGNLLALHRKFATRPLELAVRRSIGRINPGLVCIPPEKVFLKTMQSFFPHVQVATDPLSLRAAFRKCVEPYRIRVPGRRLRREVDVLRIKTMARIGTLTGEAVADLPLVTRKTLDTLVHNYDGIFSPQKAPSLALQFEKIKNKLPAFLRILLTAAFQEIELWHEHAIRFLGDNKLALYHAHVQELYAMATEIGDGQPHSLKLAYLQRQGDALPPRSPADRPR